MVSLDAAQVVAHARVTKFDRAPVFAVNVAVASGRALPKDPRKRKTPMNLPHKHPPGREPPDLPPKPEPEPDTKLRIA
jgi:hypothetical protein